MLVLLVWNVTLNGPLFEDMEQRLHKYQAIFQEISEARRPAIFRNNDRPTRTQHVHVWLKHHRTH